MKRMIFLFILLATTASTFHPASLQKAVFADGTREGEKDFRELFLVKIFTEETTTPLPFNSQLTQLCRKIYIPYRVILNAVTQNLQLHRRGDWRGLKAYTMLVNLAYNRKDGNVICALAKQTIYEYIYSGKPVPSEHDRARRILSAQSLIQRAIDKVIYPDVYAAQCAIKRGADGSRLAFVEALFASFEVIVIQQLETEKATLDEAGIFADEELACDIFTVFEHLLLFTAASAHTIIDMAPSKNEHIAILATIKERTRQLTRSLAASLSFTLENTEKRSPSIDSEASDDDSAISLTFSPGSSTSLSSENSSPRVSPSGLRFPKKSCLHSELSTPRFQKVTWLDLYKEPQHWSDEVEFNMPFNLDVWGFIKGIPGAHTACKVARVIRDLPTVVEDAITTAFEELRITNEILAGSGLFSPRHDGGCPCCSSDWQDVFEDDATRQTERK